MATPPTSQCTTSQCTPSRSAALAASQPRTSSRGRSFFESLINRELAPRRISPAALLSELSCDGADEHAFADVYGRPVPPFCPRYCPWAGSSHILGVADEDGWLSMIDTNKGARIQPSGNRPGSWRAHHNAIFDFCWSPAKGKLITASGDQSVRLWDVERAARSSGAAFGGGPATGEVLLCRGHTGSVKSVAPRPNDPFVFASGSRDGCVNIYDVRQGPQPAMTLQSVHNPTWGGPKRKRAGGLSGGGNHGVTSVVYLMDDKNMLATAGGTDGAVKLWDSRLGGASRGSGGRGSAPRPGGASSSLNGPSTPLCTLLPSRGSERHHGITSLAIDGTGGRLLASSTDGKIYCYDTVRPERGEVARFGGHHVHTFYVKARFSQDGRFILSGSSDGNVYIWQVDHPDLPPIYLPGHRAEVTGVDWSPTDVCQVASCSDDGDVRVWRVQRGTAQRAPVGTPLAGLELVDRATSPRTAAGDVHPMDCDAPPANLSAGADTPQPTPPLRRTPVAATSQASLRDYLTPPVRRAHAAAGTGLHGYFAPAPQL